LHKIVIVGAGPAGIAAGAVLAKAGLSITLIDEGSQPGGQIHRAPAPGLALDMRALLGRSHADYRRFHVTAENLCGQVDYQPGTLAWNVYDRAVQVTAAAGLAAVPYDALVIATGATDRVMPVAGWTLPGVFTLGGAQALLKGQGCLIGTQVAFCGSSPLLYVAALQYQQLGGRVAAVIDTTPFRSKLRAVPNLLAAPAMLAKGLRSMAALRRRGIPIVHGARIEAFEGEDRVSAVSYRDAGGGQHRVACDGVAYGHGLRSESQLAEVAGCSLQYDAVQRQYRPVVDRDGRAGRGIYLAGDGGTIGGAEAARVSGALAGAAILADLGVAAPAPDVAALRRSLRRLRRFQAGVAEAFAWPHAAAAALADAVVICRCENVTVGEVRQAIRQGASEANRVKAATRCGMGRCQGRFCGPALAELTAATPLDRLRAQPPIKPLPIAAAQGAPL
jgi:NADPH-dependent 2,4-dienoyl-CoA reductase/sulfur reductase-like enzyme